MKSAKETVYELIQQIEFSKKASDSVGVETSDIAKRLGIQRSNASALLNQLCAEGKLKKVGTRPVLYTVHQKNEQQSTETSCFKSYIGYNGSLRSVVQLAKASILYPQKSLNTLIIAPRGCGTSLLAKLMFSFAKEVNVIDESAQFVKLNCNHYIDNKEALRKELFGLPDSTEDFQNCFDRAEHGVLFIDNVNLLEGQDQENINTYLETGSLYYDNDKQNKVQRNVLLILACSNESSRKNIENYVSKIPMKIEIPSLEERPLLERFELINRFLSIEAARSNRQIEVNSETMKSLLLYDCPLNVKQLNHDIKIACANAYVRSYQDVSESIVVNSYDFESYVRKGLLNEKKRKEELESLIVNDNTYIFDKDKIQTKLDHINTKGDMYLDIKNRANELEKRGIDKQEVATIVNSYLKNVFVEYKNQLSRQVINIEQLQKLVDEKVIEIVNNFLAKCRLKFDRDYPANIIYGLCLHINSLLTLNKNQQRISNEQITNIIQNYPEEYSMGVKLATKLKTEYELDLPIDEIVLITMFIIDVPEEKVSNTPQVLFAMHGDSTAMSLRDVTNALTKTNNTYAFDLSLNSDTQTALNELKTLIQTIDQGKGVLVIYDMGSIKTMLETIQEETKIPLRLVYMPITLIGLDAARKCSMEEDIDVVYHSVLTEIANLKEGFIRKPKVIITLCNTGEGGAEQLKEYIDKYSNLNIKTIPLAISHKKTLLNEVMTIQQANEIHAFVGTYNPKLFGIPFISISDVFSAKPKELDQILLFKPINEKCINYDEIDLNLEEQLRSLPIHKLKKILPIVMEEINDKYSLNEDQEIGLYMHIACMINNLMENKSLPKNPNTEYIVENREEDFKFVSKTMKKIEKSFNIIVPDDGIAYVLEIISPVRR